MFFAIAGLAVAANPFFAFDNGFHPKADWPPARQAALLKELGYDGIGYSGIGNLEERQKAFREKGLRIFNLYVGCHVDKPETHAPAFKDAMRKLEGTGTDLWLTVQGPAGEFDKAADVVGEIADAANAHGLRIAIYPHKGYLVASAEDALKIVGKAKRPNLGLTLNLCHELAAGHAARMQEIVRACAPHLFLVSINGADPAGTWKELIQPLGEGGYDVAGFVRMLGNAGYTGPVGLQCYQISIPPQDHLARSIAAWRTINSQ